MNVPEKQPLVSVGIPTYNRPIGLKRTLDCITQQTYLNIEIIVSNNCSTDPRVEIVAREFQEKDQRVQYFRQTENKGAAYNFSFVLKQSIGKYFMWAADDDEWEPEFIQTCLSHFNDNITLVFPKMRVLYRSSNLIEDIALPNISRYNSRAEDVKAFLDQLTPSMIYGLHHKESLIKNYEDFYFDFADCFILMKILLNGQVEVLHKVDKILYTAGIDAAEYVIKSVNPKPDRKLIYHPYIVKQINLIILSSISLKDKIKLLHKVIITTFRLFLLHERSLKDIHIVNKFKFVTAKLLVAFDSRLTWIFKKVRLTKYKIDSNLGQRVD
jgi:glycosyltransferase involved in cell wall biosynthesis